MAYNLKLAERLREELSALDNVEEKEMMGGLTFMLNNKMCIGIIKDEMMCRINPDLHNDVVERDGCRTMDFTKKPMKGYVMVDEFGMSKKSDFDFMINLSLEYNKIAKASKKRKKKE